MKKILLAITIYATSLACMAQSGNSNLLFIRDSTLHAMIHADSLK
ncbi:MAG TPA: hypothetical protein VMU83_06190 [Hanamia sp.]|nr:hypothetical protein [Hanamia sp.]